MKRRPTSKNTNFELRSFELKSHGKNQKEIKISNTIEIISAFVILISFLNC